MKAVVLLSGGLDSTTALYQALSDGCSVICLSIHYGQLHERELESAKKIAAHLNLEHWIIPLSLPWGGSALLNGRGAASVPSEGGGTPPLRIPKGRNEFEMSKEIPVTYVPARNSIFLSLAASLAETKGARAIYFGANALDYSGYPDCRPEFIRAFEEVMTLGTKVGATHRVARTTHEKIARRGNPPWLPRGQAQGGPAPTTGSAIRVIAPLLRLSKKQIVRLGGELGVPFEWTWSCYEGKDTPCGECDSCILRAKGFREAGIQDPLIVGASLNKSLNARRAGTRPVPYP